MNTGGKGARFIVGRLIFISQAAEEARVSAFGDESGR